MGSPRTLRELRAAVARVLVARGEAADALRVTSAALHGGRRAITLRHVVEGREAWHLLAGRVAGDTAAEAVARTWALVVERIAEECDHAADGLTSAEARVARARAALVVAREIGGDGG